MAESHIHLIVALPTEAKPIIAHYRLKKCMAEHAFPVYQRDEITLTISGIGKAAVAAAVAYSFILFGKQTDRLWINLGIAGHRNHAIGAAFIAHKIIDSDTGKYWYPGLCFDAPCPSLPLCTVSRPERNYAGENLYDMEASAFFETATRFSPGELIHCLKIVSDNQSETLREIDASKAMQCMEMGLSTLDGLIAALQPLHAELTVAEPPGLAEITTRWHFTEQQRIQLSRLLHRWRALTGTELRHDDLPLEAHHAKIILPLIQAQIEQLPVRLRR
jgi:nucleoside phosphorylase